jgi:homoserine O-succinyltransferase/O-acetyltransferase
MSQTSEISEDDSSRRGPSNATHQEGLPIVVGLVNNMPDSALELTEYHFGRLLEEAAPGLQICLKKFSLPEAQRSETGRAYVKQHHQNIDAMWAEKLDGLIVTGAAPHTAHLADESYWPQLAKVIDWADENTMSTIWSCLAAHAAVFHRDGIMRRPFERKLSGVFECVKVKEHPIVRGIQPKWRVPHSRHYDLSENELIANNYTVLSKSAVAGADIFVKKAKSLSVFVQGHPEYAADSLLREYCRDIRRFVEGRRASYPRIPRGYFDEMVESSFEDLEERISLRLDRSLPISFPSVEGRIIFDWRGTAVRLYSNWISYILQQKRSRIDREH